MGTQGDVPIFNRNQLGLRSLSGLKVFLGSPFQTRFLFRAVDAAFFEDFVLGCH
jgi:hypothetical protein